MKNKFDYVCVNCGSTELKWLGRCNHCKSWNSLEERGRQSQKNKSLNPKDGPKLVEDIRVENIQRFSSGISEIDRVLGGGVVPGSVVLFGGEPGVGKSTLLLELCGKIQNINPSKKILYVSGEESEGQIYERITRLDIKNETLKLYQENIWENIKNQLEELKPDILILDSIQTTYSEDTPSPPGSLSQIREVTFEIMNFSKKKMITSFIVGHVTKDGHIAGPKVLEHMVDTVIFFEADRLGIYRILRVIKNRFGNVNEMGIFEMSSHGLKEVKYSAEIFLDTSIGKMPGRALTCIQEGNRTLFVEVQSLVVDSTNGQGKRNSQGVDSNRVAMLVAVLEKYLHIETSFKDIYINLIGGLRISENDIDLSILASLYSSIMNIPVLNRIVFLGEVGLSGEVRSVSKIANRLKEVESLEYNCVVTSKNIANEYRNRFNLEFIGLEGIHELVGPDLRIFERNSS